MKHLKLFESFNDEILIGFFGDGGIGSHPAIISKLVLSKIEEADCTFETTDTGQNLPESLLCIWDDTNELGWTIKGISNSLANQINSLNGTDFYYPNMDESFMEDSGKQLLKSALGSAGYPVKRLRDIRLVCIIRDVKLNTIYWSDNPEETHDIWDAPYKAIPLLKYLRDIS